MAAIGTGVPQPLEGRGGKLFFLSPDAPFALPPLFNRS